MPQTLLEILRKAEEFLASKKIPSPRLEAQLIFAHFLKLKRIELFTQSDRPLTEAELVPLRAALKRKAAGEPTAYILETHDFFGRPFAVSPAVLIPRPETEELVEHILKKKQSAFSIADAGAGSGCIGITLALETNARALTLLDISKHALDMAQKNAAVLLSETETEVMCLEGNFTLSELSLPDKVQIFVSNPPYVLTEEFSNLENSVRLFEPRTALVAENFEKEHRALLAFAFRSLDAGGLFALETHPAKSQDAVAWARDAGFAEVEIQNDLAARPHFVFARKP